MANPLFTYAAKALRDAALAEFQRTTVGKLLKEAERMKRNAAKPANLSGMLRRYKKVNWQSATREIMGTEMGQLAAGIERYAKRGGGAWSLLSGFLDAMGPTGQILKALAMPTKASKGSLNTGLQAAMNLLQAFGYEVLPNKQNATAADMQRGIEAARKMLEDQGYKVLAPGEEPPRPDKTLPFNTPKKLRSGTPRKHVNLLLETGTKRFAVDHPIVTGDWTKTPQSTNVYSFRYDVERRTLYVRFRANPEDGSGYVAKPFKPGPVYAYYHVPAKVFLGMLDAPSKGTFIWDELRVRGTISGHQFDYSLYSVRDGYVPRKATLRADGEYFVPRQVRGRSGRIHASQLPEQMVRPLFGKSTDPNRGGPNRGEPNRGRP